MPKFVFYYESNYLKIKSLYTQHLNIQLNKLCFYFSFIIYTLYNSKNTIKRWRYQHHTPWSVESHRTRGLRCFRHPFAGTIPSCRYTRRRIIPSGRKKDLSINNQCARLVSVRFNVKIKLFEYVLSYKM